MPPRRTRTRKRTQNSADEGPSSQRNHRPSTRQSTMVSQAMPEEHSYESDVFFFAPLKSISKMNANKDKGISLLHNISLNDKDKLKWTGTFSSIANVC